MQMQFIVPNFTFIGTNYYFGRKAVCGCARRLLVITLNHNLSFKMLNFLYIIHIFAFWQKTVTFKTVFLRLYV